MKRKIILRNCFCLILVSFISLFIIENLDSATCYSCSYVSFGNYICDGTGQANWVMLIGTPIQNLLTACCLGGSSSGSGGDCCTTIDYTRDPFEYRLVDDGTCDSCQNPCGLPGGGCGAFWYSTAPSTCDGTPFGSILTDRYNRCTNC